MPRIDPLQLLKCLSVLLAPDGGIKSKEEVSRLVSLMTKFSKKLVSKCIYIQILRATKSDLLDMFMGAGGWDLTHQWLLDAIMAKNHPLNCEILQLLSLCPVNVDRLRSNSCPKLVKNLSIESTNDSEKMLASNLVMQWMQVVRNEVDVAVETVSGPEVAVVDVPVVEKDDPVSTVSVDVVVESSVDTRTNNSTNDTVPEVISVQPLEKQVVDSENVQRVTVVEGEERTEEGGGTSEDSNSPWDAPLPLYKIMIRDGKQVLAKVYSEKRQASELSDGNVSSHHHNISGTVIVNVTPGEEKELEDIQPSESPVIVAPCSVSEKDSVEIVKVEETVEHVTEEHEATVAPEKKVKAIMSDTSPKANEATVRAGRETKKRLKDSKPAVAAPSEKKPRLQESNASKEKMKEKERGKGKEKVKEEKKKDVKNNLQAEKDKETLAKIMIVSSAVSKTVGKIPKKNRTSEDNNGEVKKVAAAPEVRRTPKVSVSIERRSQGSTGEPRPKTVKTFNSKFRSTGLEEEVKPPPPRSATKKNSTSDKNTRISIPSRRLTPPKDIFPPEKKARAGAGIVSDVASASVGVLSQTEELPRKGEKAVVKSNAIKAKEKPSVAFLQESDVFMDALTAVTRKEPRRRKRRISSSKDDEKGKGKESDPRKDDLGEGHYAPGTPPHSPDEKSPPVLKPSFKFYQDTLETEEDNKKIKEEVTHEDEMNAPVLTVKEEGSPVPESDGSDEESRRSAKKKFEHDTVVKDESKKRIKLEEDEGESSESDETTKRKEGSVKGLKGVLVYHKKLALKAKKTVKWKDDGELEKIVYFELDETERVNVTKTFMDMKQMERTHEREAFQMARKLAHEDVMEERMTWQPLIPISLPPPLVDPGSKSREKDVQYAREKVVLQSLYFHRDMIPDSPSEPDIENHPTTDPAIIPLNDVSGNPDSVNDFQTTPWPEPKAFQPPTASGPSVVSPGSSLSLIPGIPEHNDGSYMPQHPHQHMVQGHPMVGGMTMQYGNIHPQMAAHPLHAGFATPAVPNPNIMAPMDNTMHPRSSHPINMAGPRPILHPQNSQQLPINNMMNPSIQGVAGGDWRTADGKVVPVEEAQPIVMYAQGGVPDVGMGGNNTPQMDGDINSGYEMEYGVVQYQEGMEEGHVGGPGYMMPPMGYGGSAGGNVRPPHAGAMYVHPPMFRGNGSRGGRGGPAPTRGGPWFRPSGPMPPRGRGGNWEGGRGRGGRGGLRVTVCKHFRAGYCRNGEQCSFLHPGVNGPPVPYMYPE